VALILIADHDPILSEALQRQYQSQGHQAMVASTSHDAMRLAEEYSPDVVVLNAGLPYYGAAEVYQRLKALPRLSGTPVLAYSMQLQLAEEAQAFARKAKVRQPSPVRELAMKTAAVLQRENGKPASPPSEHLIAGRLILHARNLTVEVDGKLTHLTRTEFELLRYLMLHVDEACASRRLLQTVWGYPPGSGSTDVVRAHVRNLRHKIEDQPDQPRHLRTIRNCGYMLCSDGHEGTSLESCEGDPGAKRRLLRHPLTASSAEAPG